MCTISLCNLVPPEMALPF
uniref:Uncharacterized protein n=1 Tax=Rhizophora mucronata TaxID=61149 RepID=A0A2P2R1Q3_RHIMU